MPSNSSEWKRWFYIPAYSNVSVEEGFIPLKIDEKVTYAILGAGSVGYLVAKELMQRGRKFVIVEKDKEKAETLRDQNFETEVGDITQVDVIERILVPELEIVMILSSDVDANAKALSKIKAIRPDIFTIVRATDPLSKDKLEEMGADAVIYPASLIASATLHDLEKAESQRSANRLLDILRTVNKLGIVIHDNPDPDGISSALALQEIARSVAGQADIMYRGEIGRQENRAFVNLLNIELKEVEELNVKDYDMIALVDSAVPGANNPLVSIDKLGIIIDHHEPYKNHVPYIDIRAVGATATILTTYLQELDIDIDKRLATALLYGIRTDTHDFKRNVSLADLAAVIKLLPLVDNEILVQIESPPMSAETIDLIGEAIKNKCIRGSYLISNVGFVTDRDALAQAADYLLNLEGISTVLVFGLNDERIYISGRSRDVRVNIGAIMSKAFSSIGSAGGHANAAAAQIDLGVFSGVKNRETLLNLVEDAITRRFYSVVGVERCEKA